MKSYNRAEIKEEIAAVTVSLAIVLMTGTFGYMIVEDWNFLDSLYMTVITLATIGYGETHPLSPAGRIFTIFLIFGGLGFVAYSFSLITAIFVGGHLTDVFRRSRMAKRISSLKNHFVICGANATGMCIASELKAGGGKYVFVDANASAAEQLLAAGHPVICGDPTDDDVLKTAAITRARGLFSALEGDRDNAFAALTAKTLNPALKVVSRQRDEGAARKLFQSGADAVVNTAGIGALRMVSEMVRPKAVAFMDLILRKNSGTFIIEEIPVPRGTGRTFAQLNDMPGVKVLAVRRPRDQDYSINPPRASCS
ncbi:MAG: NAD-binding protein [Elusimicrobiaceae bacterium]|nr:NAD-binding protein [Elusimicrobiaceae bacterium]